MQSLSALLTLFLATALASPTVGPHLESKVAKPALSSITINVDAFTLSSTNGHTNEVSFHATAKDPVLLDLSCTTKSLNDTEPTFDYNRIYSCGKDGAMSFSYADGEGVRDTNYLKLWFSSDRKSFTGGMVIEDSRREMFSLILKPVGF